MSERRLLVRVEAERYLKARKKEKGRIQDELVALSSYNRWYAVGLLRGQGNAIKVGRRLRLMGDLGRSTKQRRPRIYDGVVLQWLKKIWAILDFVCRKRLTAIIPEVVPVLERHLEIALDAATRQKLFSISPATLNAARYSRRRLGDHRHHRSSPSESENPHPSGHARPSRRYNSARPSGGQGKRIVRR